MKSSRSPADGKELAVGGFRFSYLPPHAESSAYVEDIDRFEDRDLADHPRLRRVLIRLLPGTPVASYLLHFSDGTDLHRLDERIAAGTATDDDFRGALLGEALSIVCQHCEAVLRAVVVDTGHPLFAADRAQRLREHEFRRECPVCGERLTLYVLEWIDRPC